MIRPDRQATVVAIVPEPPAVPISPEKLARPPWRQDEVSSEIAVRLEDASLTPEPAPLRDASGSPADRAAESFLEIPPFVYDMLLEGFAQQNAAPVGALPMPQARQIPIDPALLVTREPFLTPAMGPPPDETQPDLPQDLSATMFPIDPPSSAAMLPSSGSLAKPAEPGRSFWFNINAELIIYGATEPDAQVTIQGLPVSLQPDGSFSIRLALPDGTHTVQVGATSASGKDHQTAALRFQRETQYPQDK